MGESATECQSDCGRGFLRKVLAVVLSAVLISTIATALLSERPTEPSTDFARTLSAGDRILRIGWVDLMGNIATLNPLLYTVPQEEAIIWPCYSTLFTLDSDSESIGDLVRTYSVSGDGLVWDFKLYESAQFYDRSNPPSPYGSGPVKPVTARDVIYTYNMVQNETTCSLNSFLPLVAGVPIIQSMTWGPTFYDLRISLSSPYAPIWSAFQSIPILPRYVWIDHYDPPSHKSSWNWANYATGVSACIGSGPFFYNLTGLPMTGLVELRRSHSWFGTEEHGWKPRCDRLVYKSEISPAALLSDLQNGLVDIILYCTPDQFLNTIPTIPGLVTQTSSEGFEYELCVNQMTDAMRSALGSPFTSGTSNQLLQDPVVRLALSMSIDRPTFVSDVLGGLGEPGESFVPLNHPYHYTYGSSPYDQPISFDPIAARSLLMNAGWSYRLDGSQIVVGSPDYSSYYPLCKMGGTSPLRFRFWTLVQSSDYNIGGLIICQRAASAGIDLYSDYSLKTVNEMNSAWLHADYDLLLWFWWFELGTDVSQILNIMTTMAMESWSDSFYSNSTYDDLYNLSLVTIIPDERRMITDQMQRMLYENHGGQAVAYRDELFAMKSSAPDHWTSWGDWSSQPLLEPALAYPWLYLRISPQDNPAPVVTSIYSHFECLVNQTITLSAAATDSSPNLEYRWNFGDGTKSAWSSSPSATHVYSAGGFYRADFMVRETTTSDGFMSSATMTVRAADPGNSAPENLDFTWFPSSPNNGMDAQLFGSATDSDGDPMTFTWDFGDGSTATGQNVSHRFTTGPHSVTMYVDDGHLGLEPRPSAMTKLVVVVENSPPWMSVTGNPVVMPRQWTLFQVTYGDNDSEDQHRFTWFWGDGSCSVTSFPNSTHTYYTTGPQNFTVFCDDLTGLAGHNVSGSAVNVVWHPNRPPVINSFTANSTSVYVGWEINFTCIATDINDDLLMISFDFGDGTFANFSMTSPVNVSASHAYSAPGIYDTWVTVSDGQAAPVTSVPLIVTVDQPSVLLSLVHGWNFVGIPLLGSYMASNIGLQYGDVVVQYNASVQTYTKSYIVGISPPSYDFALTPGVGFWIYAQTDEAIRIYGSLPVGPQSVPLTVPIGGGWVPFVFLGLKTHHASEVPGMLSGPVQIIATYDPVTHTYKSYIVGLPPTDFTILPGQAIWLYLTNSVTITYAP